MHVEIIRKALWRPHSRAAVMVGSGFSLNANAITFTTNYDTLLERTRLKAHEIRHDVVQTPEDIARSEKPRIIKLHGSFPSHRPFIFTAEDYRNLDGEETEQTERRSCHPILE